MRTNRLVLVVLSVSLALVGCGSSSKSGTTGHGTARLVATIQWAEAPTRMMPTLAQSVYFVVAYSDTWVDWRIVDRPTSATTSTITFDSVPVGLIRASASAWSEPNGKGKVLADAYTECTTEAGHSLSLPLTMESRITSVRIVGPTSVAVGSSIPLTFSATDNGGGVVLVPPVTWSVVNAADTVSLTDGRANSDHGVTVNGLKWGQAVVRASVEQQAGESASEVSSTVVLTVLPAAERTFKLTMPQTTNLDAAVVRAVSDASGNLYVVWTSRSDYYGIAKLNRVQVYSPDGALNAEWGDANNTLNPYGGLLGILVGADQSLYLCDTDANRVHNATATGTYLGSWGSTSPRDIAMSPDGAYIYVLEHEDHISKRTLSGSEVLGWGSYGPPGPGSLGSGNCLATDSEGNVYIKERWLQKFSSTGTYLASVSDTGQDGRHEFAVDYADRILMGTRVFSKQLTERTALETLTEPVVACVPGQPLLWTSSLPLDLTPGVPTFTRLRTAVP